MSESWRRTYTVWVQSSTHIRMWVERIDGGQIRCGWDVLQRIKNDVLGRETTAIEVFPAESHLINEINARHLFVIDNPPTTLWDWDKLEVKDQ